MAWYWWVLLALVALGLLGFFLRGDGKASSRAEFDQIFAGPRAHRAEAEQYAAGMIAFLRDMEVAECEPGDIQSHERVSASVRNFFLKPHVRTHVVAGLRRAALIQEMDNQKGKAVTREIVRTGADRKST